MIYEAILEFIWDVYEFYYLMQTLNSNIVNPFRPKSEAETTFLTASFRERYSVIYNLSGEI